MTFVAIALSSCGVLFILIGSREAVLKRASIFVVVLISLVPLYAASNDIVIITFGIGILALLAGAALASDRIRFGLLSLPFSAVLCLELISRLRGGTPLLGAFNAVLIVFAFLSVAILTTMIGESGWIPVAKTLAVLLPFHLAVSILEQARVITTLWPRHTYMDDIAHRPNRLLEFLPGRSMSTLGHPIVLGFICGVTAILALHYLLESRRWWGIVLVASVVTLGLSGARSASFATALACLYLYLGSRRSGTRIVVMTLALAVGVLFLNAGYFTEDSFSEVETQSSYTHRLSVTSGVEAYVQQASAGSLVFGRGIYDYGQFLTDGVFGTREDLTSFDNQIVRTLVVTGVLGVAAVAAAAVIGWRRPDPVARAAILYSVVLMFSFDMFTWLISLVVFGAATSLPAQRTAPPDFSPARALRVTPITKKVG